MNPERIDAPTMREAGLPKNLSVKPILPPVMRTRIIQMAVFFNNLAVYVPCLYYSRFTLLYDSKLVTKVHI